MKIAIAADHGGFELKQKVADFLAAKEVEFIDVGCYSTESVDYPDFADKAVGLIEEGQCQTGILICGTGIGMSIAANRKQFIRAALCWDDNTAKLSREHNNANILCLGARVISEQQALSIIDVWLKTEFEGGRHLARISKFSS